MEGGYRRSKCAGINQRTRLLSFVVYQSFIHFDSFVVALIFKHSDPVFLKETLKSTVYRYLSGFGV